MQNNYSTYKLKYVDTEENQLGGGYIKNIVLNIWRNNVPTGKHITIVCVTGRTRANVDNIIHNVICTFQKYFGSQHIFKLKIHSWWNPQKQRSKLVKSYDPIQKIKVEVLRAKIYNYIVNTFGISSIALNTSRYKTHRLSQITNVQLPPGMPDQHIEDPPTIRKPNGIFTIGKTYNITYALNGI